MEYEVVGICILLIDKTNYILIIIVINKNSTINSNIKTRTIAGKKNDLSQCCSFQKMQKCKNNFISFPFISCIYMYTLTVPIPYYNNHHCNEIMITPTHTHTNILRFQFHKRKINEENGKC